MHRALLLLLQSLPHLFVFLIALFVYLLTLAPGITWAHHGFDGGELITASHTLGVPHPPGYPTYVVLTKLVSRIPLGAISWRYNLFSALCVALAAAFVAASAGALLRRTQRQNRGAHLPVQLATGLSFAFMPLVWGQATITEVYALNLAVLAVLLWALLSGRSPRLVGLLLGLSITTHLTSLLMVPLVAGMTPRRWWTSCLLGVLVGLTPFLLIPLLAGGDSPVVWGEPASPAGWWWLVSARLYRPNVLGVPLSDWPARLASGFLGLLWQLAYLGAVILGVTIMRHGPANRRLYALMVLTVLLYALYAVAYDAVDAHLFFLPGLLILSLFLAEGLLPLGWVALLLPGALLVLNFQIQDLRRDLEVDRRAVEVLESAPENAVLMSPGDQTIFTLWYYQHVAGRRTDLVLVDQNLFAFDWYRRRLGTIYPDLNHLELDDLPGFVRGNPQRPHCQVSLATGAEINCPPP